MRSVLIVNPKAKRGRALSLARQAQGELLRHGWQCDLLPSESGEHVRHLTHQALQRGVDAVFVCGGDGTIHHAVQALALSPTPLGIIPCGRGNDLVRALGIPLDPTAAARVIAGGRTHAIDLGVVRGEYFCGIVTCGFDSAVADFAYRHRSIPGGWVGYLGAALVLLARYQFRRVQVDGDGVAFDGRVLLVATANCPAYGGGLWIAPTAQLDDGLLHVCIVRETSKWRILRLLPTVFTGAHIHEPEVSLHAVRKVRLQSDEPLPLFADGEPVGATPATVTVVPSALRVFVP
ncbi:Diacylglycerol kinase [bacterium HR17]|uniref:Diacylglycerol kinase n=1 Tax=Candidatus Fervidibacter japonicus TaxID=2035412 RepID=A0A2H5XDX5_9BACT|nr:Diacylglycerol kinase [bacterium HR17]